MKNKLLEIDPLDASAYVTLANIYAAAGLHKKAIALRITMQKKGIKKVPGFSKLIELDGTEHRFVANDQSHPRIAEINAKWHELAKLIEYVPNIAWTSFNESNERKALRLCRHSEKMALCYALIALPPDVDIYIVKNLRMCGDCHDATALISNIVKRRIIIRDARVFHTFENGKCVCCGKY